MFVVNCISHNVQNLVVVYFLETGFLAKNTLFRIKMYCLMFPLLYLLMFKMKFEISDPALKCHRT